MARNIFSDPAAVLSDYSWRINHSEEEEGGQSRDVDHTANTGLTGLVRQQGAAEPAILQYKGTILHRAQVVEMLKWFEACRTRTIIFQDFAGDRYEVLITSFKPQRLRAAKNNSDYANAPLWYWKYSMTMEVLTFLTGVYAEAGVTP